jgi:hypothetical protein
VRNLIHANSRGEVTEKESEQKIKKKIWQKTEQKKQT